MIYPIEGSASFLSFTGSMDTRVELDQSIKPGDCRYFGALAVMAAKASYENKAYLEKTVQDNWNVRIICTQTHTHAREYIYLHGQIDIC